MFWQCVTVGAVGALRQREDKGYTSTSKQVARGAEMFSVFPVGRRSFSMVAAIQANDHYRAHTLLMVSGASVNL